MTNKKMMLLGIDVLYFIMTCILFIYCVGEYELIDLLFLIVYIVYYFRIKIYNWKKYHLCGIFILRCFYVY